LARSGKPIILTDKKGNPFSFALPDAVLEQLHQIDLGTGGLVSVPEPITNPHTRDRYLVSSLMEEAITSSQLEGAATTREVAKDLIRTGRKPRDTSEQMILNNFRTMQKIREWKDLPLTPELVFDIHQLVTENTMEDPSATGRLRREDEKRVVADDTGEVYHDPPDAGELPTRLLAMCAFANETTSDSFIHPAVRAILLHFWLAYDHPFVDGNGRTARALFYWSMLHAGLLDCGRGRELRQRDLPSAQRMLERDGLAVELAADLPRGKGQAVRCGGCPVGWLQVFLGLQTNRVIRRVGGF